MAAGNLSRKAWSNPKAAQRYERARPSYATQAIECAVTALSLDVGSVVLDLAAGTGKLGRLFLPHIGSLIAVEPLEGMREVLSATVPQAQVLDGNAEDIPLFDGTVDAVVVGQGWHWFDSPRALAEVDRVTTSEGGLALFWNEGNPDSEFLRQLAAIREEYAKKTRGMPPGHWRDAFTGNRAWRPLRKESFSNPIRNTRESFVERVLSSSVFAVQPAAEKRKARDLLLRLVERSPEVVDGDEVTVPYVTEVFWTRKRSSRRR